MRQIYKAETHYLKTIIIGSIGKTIVGLLEFSIALQKRNLNCKSAQ